jgi:hypothetical protein
VGADLDFFFIHLDDILVASLDVEAHKLHHHTILQRLCQFGLILNLEKCELGCSSVEFLSHHITSTGVEPLLKHVSAVRDYVRSTDMRSLQSFLGLVNFYRRFVLGAARILRLLTDALHGTGRAKLVWSPGMEAAFNHAKRAVCEATHLSHPDPEAQLCLAVDASSDTHCSRQQTVGNRYRSSAPNCHSQKHTTLLLIRNC